MSSIRKVIENTKLLNFGKFIYKCACSISISVLILSETQAAEIEKLQNVINPQPAIITGSNASSVSGTDSQIPDFFKTKIRQTPWMDQDYQNYGKTPFNGNDLFLGIVDWRSNSPESLNEYSLKLEKLGMGKTLPIPAKYFSSISLQELETIVNSALKRDCIILLQTPNPASIYNDSIKEEKILYLKKLTGEKLLIYNGEADGKITRQKCNGKEKEPSDYYPKIRQIYSRAYSFYQKNNIPYFEGTESTFDDILLKSGLPGLCCISYGNKMNTELKLAYTRGASRMNDKMLGAYPQFWGGTPNWYPGRPFHYQGPGKIGNMDPLIPETKSFTTCRRCHAPAAQYLLKPFGDEAQFFSCGKCGYAAGKPPEGYRIACLLALFSGARFFLGEEVPEAYMAENYLLPHGAILKEMRYIWNKMDRKIGNPVTPLAVMTSCDNGWNAPYKYVPKQVWGGNVPLGPAEKMFDLYEVFYPHCATIKPIDYANVEKGEEGKLSGQKWHDNDLIYPCDFTDTPYGQIDVITSDISLEKLKIYHSLIILGPFAPSSEMQKALTDYVHDGGNLLINTRQAGESAEWLEKLANIKIQNGTSNATEIHLKNPPVTKKEAEFTLDIIDPGKTEVIAIAAANPVAVFSQSEKGTVTVSAIPYLINNKNQVTEFGMTLLAAFAKASKGGVTILNPEHFEYMLTASDSSYNLLLIYYGQKPWMGAPWTLSVPGKPVESKMNSEKEICHIEFDCSILGDIGKIHDLDDKELKIRKEGKKIFVDIETGCFNYRILKLQKLINKLQ